MNRIKQEAVPRAEVVAFIANVVFDLARETEHKLFPLMSHRMIRCARPWLDGH